MTREAGAPPETSPPPADDEKTVIDGEAHKTQGPGYLNLWGTPSTVRAPAQGSHVRTLRSPGVKRENLTTTTLPPAASPERILSMEEIATGGMGAVESAFDSVLMRRVARKTMHSAANTDPEVTLRFIEEAQITAQLDHPNIVPVHDLAANLEQGKVYFTMKLVDGETLGSVFRRLHERAFSGLELERVLRIFLKVCDAVSFAHSRGVVHRDLKPDNIMVGSHGQVYVMDWGVALITRQQDIAPDSEPISVARPSSAEQSGTIVGTVPYMAPEQALGMIDEQGPRTDVYGLGAILYALLTGMGPNTASTLAEALKIARGGPVPPPEARPAWATVPPGLCRIAMKALSLPPSERHQSVDELRHEVENFLRGGGWFQVRTFAPGATIVVEGAAADAAYLVTQGHCEVFRDVAGERQLVRRVGPGEIFGEMGLLTRSPRTATVAAVDAVTVMVITPEGLEHELRDSGWLRVLLGALAERFRESDQRQAESKSGG